MIIFAILAGLIATGALGGPWLLKKLKAEKAAKATPAPSSGHTPMFIDSNGQVYNIEPAPPAPPAPVCDPTIHACKYVAPMVSITEPCQLAAMETAIETVAKNTKRIKKAYHDARQALMEFTLEEKVTA